MIEGDSKPARSIWFWLGCAVLIVATVGTGVFIGVTLFFGHGPFPWGNQPPTNRPKPYEVLRSTAVITTLLGGAAAATIAIRRQQSTERTLAQESHKLDLEEHARQRDEESRLTARDLDEVARLRDRYTAAVGQLGEPSPAVRLGGVYALAGLADDWIARSDRAQAQVCVDILCAYIRTPRGDETETDRRSDLEVRQSIIRLIRDHLNGENLNWQGLSFDFTGATFSGNYSFEGATFGDSRVVFDLAEFSGGAFVFDQATFNGGEVTFIAARFRVGVVVTFDQVTFSGAQATFYQAKFSGGQIAFFRAKFSGVVAFDRAEISGSRIFFDHAAFGGKVTFDHAAFSGGKVTFDHAAFSGGKVTFSEAKFGPGTEICGPWPGSSPPGVWPGSN